MATKRRRKSARQQKLATALKRHREILAEARRRLGANARTSTVTYPAPNLARFTFALKRERDIYAIDDTKHFLEPVQSLFTRQFRGAVMIRCRVTSMVDTRMQTATARTRDPMAAEVWRTISYAVTGPVAFSQFALNLVRWNNAHGNYVSFDVVEITCRWAPPSTRR